MRILFDVESDGLLDTATKIHCLSYYDFGTHVLQSTTDYYEMRKIFTRTDLTIVGHNIIFYDILLLEMILDIKINAKIIDTLPLSWYLFPTEKKHGLEEWGEFFGIKKPKITNWNNLPVTEYIHRCEEDVKINLKLWNRQYNYLKKLYDNNIPEITRLIEYLQFKMDCIREQEDNPVRFNYILASNLLDSLKDQKELKFGSLQSVMPKIKKNTVKTYKDVIVITPDEFYIKGDMMYDYYKANGLKPIAEYKAETLKSLEEPNPNSSTQKKEWLFSLGWIPTTFKYVKEKDDITGAETQRKVPQIMSDKKDGSLCDSVQKLVELEPKLELLEGYTILSHRIGLVEGLISSQTNGYIKGSMAGFTNTLRLKHKGLVNLPGADKKYGKEIRSLFIAEDNDLICGSDCSGLEDNCKQHYMYPYDPKYITEMRTPGFDAHLDIAMLSGMLTLEQVEDHKSGKVSYKKERAKAKTVNFASVYGAGPAKIALSGGLTLKEAKLLHKIYWKRNGAVKKVAQAFVVKEVYNQKWLFNPVSKLWYSLRAEKDRFSTGNQGLGVWCFDMWVKNVRKRGITINYQCHDEIMFRLNGRSKIQVDTILGLAMKETNTALNLNVPLAISIDYGVNYSETH